MNLELIKLGVIVGGGVLVSVLGIYYQHKKHQKNHEIRSKYNSDPEIHSGLSPNLSSEEETAKNYIKKFKSQYPRESIKTALINNGNPENKVEVWLNKYL